MIAGFVGLGTMGRPMAERLIAAGHTLVVFDLDSAPLAALEERGAQRAPDLAGVAAAADIIFTSLPDPATVYSVVDALLRSLRPGAVIVETSTIGAAQARELAARCGARRVSFLDVPVSGGVAGARNGTLAAMAGGDAAAFERVLPLLHAFAPRSVRLGDSGSGAIAKAINQLVYLTYVAAYYEGLALGTRTGLDPAALLEVLHDSVAGDPLVTGWDERIRSGDSRPGFAIARVIKDLAIGEELGAAANASLPVSSAALASFRNLEAAGFGGDDMTSLYRSNAG